MARLIRRLNVLAICLLGGALASTLIERLWPEVRAFARGDSADDEWAWRKTLQVYASHPGDPVLLVGIKKNGQELTPGTYGMPQIAGDVFQDEDSVKEWLKDVSFDLRNQGSKTIVSVGIAVIFADRRTDVQCTSITGHKFAREPWCDAHPHFCDGGCPEFFADTLHWGLIPAQTRSGLEARYAHYRAEGSHRILLQGERRLRLAPGEEITLFPDGRVAGFGAHLHPKHPFQDVVNQILFNEGIEEATSEEPCAERRISKTGCAFREVSQFNIAIDIVYFEDGAIWGNYGFGYANPNSDGIFTRVEARDF